MENPLAHFTSPPSNAMSNINSFSIRYCPNGVFHLQFGATCINVSEDMFMKMALTVEKAARDVQCLRSPQPDLAETPPSDSGRTNFSHEHTLPENVVPLRH